MTEPLRSRYYSSSWLLATCSLVDVFAIGWFAYRYDLPATFFMVFQFAIFAGLYAFTVVHVEAGGDGTVVAMSPLRQMRLNLRSGFVVKQTRLHRQNLVLEADGKAVRLNYFGALDDVNAWLKAAMHAV
jgi:hypothetical protein